MRVKGAKQVHYDSGPNMTPLVDVVMVILIFLMLAGSFGASEHYLASTVPITENGSGQVNDAVPKTIPYNIYVDGERDRFYARVDDGQTFTEAKPLAAFLTGKLNLYTATGTKVDDVQVVISPGRMVKYMYLIAVYEAALDAKFTKVSFGPPR